jgi:replicative DNA helicase
MPKDFKAKLEDLFDQGAESAIIGTLLTDLSQIVHCDLLKTEHFADPINQRVYQAIQDIYDKNASSINDITLYTQLASDPNAQAVLGKARMSLTFVKDLYEKYRLVGVSDMGQLRLHVNRVITLAGKRDYSRILKKYEDIVLDPTKVNLVETASCLESDSNKIIERYILSENAETFSDEADKIWDDILKKRNIDGTYGIPSKYSLINSYFTYEPGELYVVVARMKHGKSAFCLNELVDKLDKGIPCLYLDTENTKEKFFIRLLAHKAGVDQRLIKSGSYDPKCEPYIQRAMRWIKEKGSILCYRYDPEWTPDKIYTICKTMKHKMGFKFMIYDYMKDTESATMGEQYNRLGNLCNFLKNNIAGKFNVPVLSAAQEGRVNQQKNPKEMYIADSDKIARYLTVAMHWRKKTKEEIETDGKECGNYCLSIPISRDSNMTAEDEYLDFQFYGSTMCIEEAKQHNPLEVFD